MRKSLPLVAGLILCVILLCRAIVWACPQLPIISHNATTPIAISAALGTSPANQTFNVWNSGTGTLDFTISDNQTWLSASPSTGASSGDPVGVTVTFNTSALSAGIHNAEITITGNAENSPQKIDVTLTVVAPEYRSTPKMHGNWN